MIDIGYFNNARNWRWGWQGTAGKNTQTYNKGECKCVRRPKNYTDGDQK